MKKQSLTQIIGAFILIFLLYICQSSEAFVGYPVQPWDQWVVHSGSSFGDYRDWAPGYHSGIDLNLASGATDDLGEPVYAIADGEAFKIDDLGGGGWCVVIKHTASSQPFIIPARSTPEYQYIQQSETEIYSVYIHIQPVSKLANEITGPDGTTVIKGEIIGHIMDPGGGPHLHFEIRSSDSQHSNGGSMLLPVSNWAPSGTVENNGHYLNIQDLVVSGARHPLDFLEANVSRILSIVPSPSTPTSGIANQVFNLDVTVGLEAASDGILQVSIPSKDVEEFVYIPAPQSTVRTLSLSFTESSAGTQYYDIYVQFRPGATSGPLYTTNVEDTVDTYSNYQINWEDLSGPNVVDIYDAINVDTQWNNSFYYVVHNSINIAQGVTLTISPGTLVMFDGTNSGLNVQGTLIADGTPEQPITFTSNMGVFA